MYMFVCLFTLPAVIMTPVHDDGRSCDDAALGDVIIENFGVGLPE